MVHLGALQSVAAALKLELLGVIAEPYAVATCLDPGELGDAGAIFIDVGGGTTDVALVRRGGVAGTKMLALGGRAFTKGLADRFDLAFARAEAVKIALADGAKPPEPIDADAARQVLATDAAVWRRGVALMIEDLAAGELLPGRIYVCGGGARLPQVHEALADDAWWRELPFARRPAVRRLEPGEIPGIRDATGELTTEQDVTPIALGPPGAHPRRADERRRARHATGGTEPRPVSDDTSLIYLEPDDEITTVVRRLRETDAPRVILVAPGRTKATTSAVGLRLVGALARDEGREIVLVGDAAARSLAAEAGIAAVASVAEARSLAVGAMPASAGTAPERARISVVRGERRPVGPVPQPAEPAARPPVDRFDETRPVPVAAPAIAPPRAKRRTATRRRPDARRLPGPAVAALLLLVLLGGVAGAAVVLPGATVRIVPAAQAIGPFSYDVALPVAGTEQGTLTASADGTATGEDVQLVAATGTVTFLNYTYVVVEVPQGTKVSAAGGTVVFTTTERILVPAGDQPIRSAIVPGEGSVGVVAADAGKGGNVPAEAIDTVERRIDSRLKGFPSQTGGASSTPTRRTAGRRTTAPRSSRPMSTPP